MIGPPRMSERDDVIPLPLDDDDDDVAWALQTAAVQWRRGAKADSVVWLRRAVESAMEVGHVPRATQLNELIAGVEERIVADIFSASEPTTVTSDGVDDLLDTTVSTSRASIDIEFDEGDRTDMIVSSSELIPGDSLPVPGSPPPSAPSEPPGPAVPLPRFPLPSEPRRARPPPPPSALAREKSAPPPPVSPMLPAEPDEPFSSEPPRSVAPDSLPTVSAEEADILGELPPVSEALGSLDLAPSVPAPPPFSELPPAQEAGVIGSDGSTLAPLEAPAEPALADVLGITDLFPPAESAAEAVQALAEPEAEVASAAAPPAKSEAPDPGPRIRGVSLADVAGLQDLPPEAQEKLVQTARIDVRDVDEEVSGFAVALVVEGWASIMPAIADVACAFAQVGDVVFTHGTFDDPVALRVVAGETDTAIAVWDREALEAATSDCPWVADELRLVADRFQGLAGAAMGPLGDRLDDTLRQMVTDRCEVRSFLPGEAIVASGKPVPGMFIVGGGAVELVSGEDVVGELGPGEFLFATSVMAASPAPMGARAGAQGVLLLFAERHTAHELLVSVPPLLEILAG